NLSYRKDSLPRNDPFEDILAADHRAENGIGAVEMRLRRMGDEELAATRVRPGQGHAERPGMVTHAAQLVAYGVPRPSGSVPAGIASRIDAVGYAPGPLLSVEDPALGECQEVRHGHRGLLAEQLSLGPPFFGFDANTREDAGGRRWREPI